MVLIQEGIMEQPNWRTWVWRYTRLMPRPLATPAVFGLTRRYEKFCVASEGYRKQFLAAGISPDKLVVTAHTPDGEVMGVRHRTEPTHGVQFHPEVTHTKQGTTLLRRFVTDICGCKTVNALADPGL